MEFFHIRKIDNVLSTGGWPTEGEHIGRLKKEGFSTIVSLEPLEDRLALQARKHGLKVINLSVDWHQPVPRDKIKRFLSIAALAHAKREKIFLHCLEGRDRTGEMTAAYIFAKKSFDRAGELGLEAPLRLFKRERVEEMQEHYKKTLKRALRYRRRL